MSRLQALKEIARLDEVELEIIPLTFILLGLSIIGGVGLWMIWV